MLASSPSLSLSLSPFAFPPTSTHPSCALDALLLLPFPNASALKNPFPFLVDPDTETDTDDPDTIDAVDSEVVLWFIRALGA